MRALLAVAEQVQRGGRHVTDEAVAAARAEGATDADVHDTVLVAAAFCMFNRYVDGLAALTPTDPAAYEMMTQIIVEQGYVRAP
jgi:alkylhydroperoxidase family enzyme